MKQSYVFFNVACALAIIFSCYGLFFVFKSVEKTKEKKQSYETIIFDNETHTSLSEKETENDSVTIPTPLPTTDTQVVEEETESIVSLPTKKHLVVPFTSQAPEGNWDQPWQDACEEAAVLMLDAYYKGYGLSPLFAKDELQKIVDWETAKGWGGSIEIAKVKEVVDYYMDIGHQTSDIGQALSDVRRLTSRIIENPSVEDIKRYIANDTPVLVVADGKKLPNPNFTNGGPVYHALVIIGYTETTFITNDPGTRNGKDFEYKYNDLMNAMGDWNNGNPSEGKKVVLVVE